MAVERPIRCDLAQLARKYRALGELRQGAHHAPAIPSGLRELSREFPGALRELDMLPLDEIHRRAEALEAAARAGHAEPWMEWLCAYHAAMRAALHVKRRLAGARGIDGQSALELAREASRAAGYPCDSDFVHAVARPRAGRLNTVVFERIEADFGVRSGSIWQSLFPERRPLPHRHAP